MRIFLKDNSNGNFNKSNQLALSLNDITRINSIDKIRQLYNCWMKDFKCDVNINKNKNRNATTTSTKKSMTNLLKDRLNNHKFRGPLAWIFLHITGVFNALIARPMIIALCNNRKLCVLDQDAQVHLDVCQQCRVRHCNFFRQVCVL